MLKELERDAFYRRHCRIRIIRAGLGGWSGDVKVDGKRMNSHILVDDIGLSSQSQAEMVVLERFSRESERHGLSISDEDCGYFSSWFTSTNKFTVPVQGIGHVSPVRNYGSLTQRNYISKRL